MLKIINKPATNFKRYGQKRSGTSNGAPDSIEIHSIGCAQDEALKIFGNMNQISPTGIVNAIVDCHDESTVYEILPYDNVTWADAGYGNQHSFTIEMAESDYMVYQPNSANFMITDQAKFKADINRGYRTYVAYVAKKCLEFGLYPMDKLPNGLYKVYGHYEAAAKGLASKHADPDHIFEEIGKNMDAFRQDVAVTMQSAKEPIVPVVYSPTRTKEQFIEVVGAIAKRLYAKYGFLASVITAQACCESGFGLGADAIELTKRNNIIGMKSELINTTWKQYTLWKGESYRKKTPENYGGKAVQIYDNFRVYDSFDQCLEDYCLFLTYVKNDQGLKYADLAGTKDPKTLITGISKRGYATDPDYIPKIMRYINDYGLTRFDSNDYIAQPVATADKYVVREEFDNPGSQTNSFNNLDYAKREADKYGYNVYEAANGKLIYSGKKATKAEPASLWVGKVTASLLNVRTGPGLEHPNLPGYPYLAKGNLIDVLEEHGNWYYIRIGTNHYGYVSATYIARA